MNITVASGKGPSFEVMQYIWKLLEKELYKKGGYYENRCYIHRPHAR